VQVDGGPIGVAARGNIALVAQLQLGSIARLDLTTDAVVTSIGVGAFPVIIAFNPSGTTAYVSNLGSQNVSIVDLASNTQTGTIPVTGDPFALAINPGGTNLFVTTNVNRVFNIDLATNSVVGFLDLPATSHHILASPNDTLLYVATRDGGSVLEVNWRTMSLVRTFALGGVPQGLAIAPDRSELYVANEGTGVLHFVTLSSGSFTSTPLAGAGEGLTLSADGTTLWVGLVFNGQVQAVDRVSRAVVQTITSGGTPRELATDAVRGRILVANEAGWVDIIQ
jgi:YVTN family beta-propeller protein